MRPMCVSRTKLRPLACALGLVVVCPVSWANKAKALDTAPVVIDQRLVDAAMDRLQQRQRERAASAPVAPLSDASDPYSLPTTIARKLEMIRAYDGRLVAARVALRRNLIPPSEVRRLVYERAALQALPLEKFRTLIMQADQQNAQRLERFQEAFGDLPTAARTVCTILMKSGQIDFATPLPEDPLTREVEEARGVRRVYFQFYLNPPAGPPRRHNGYVEFVYDHSSALWVPTWTDYCGEVMPLFDAEAFVPLRPYQLVYDGKIFVVAQAQTVRPPQVFALLTPRWNAQMGIFAPAPQRW